MPCVCGNGVADMAEHLGYCSADCLDAELFWHQIREPLARLLDEEGAA